MTTINDANYKFLKDATGRTGPYNDLYFYWLRSLGYNGTLQDMIAKSGYNIFNISIKPALFADYPAPETFKWVFVYDDQKLVVDQFLPVVDLVEI